MLEDLIRASMSSGGAPQAQISTGRRAEKKGQAMTKAAVEFEGEDTNELLRVLVSDQAPDSRVAFGERLAAMVLSKSKHQLKGILRQMDAESGPALFNLLKETE